MRRHAKAATAGSTKDQAGRLGRFFRGAFTTRGRSLDVKGSSAPKARRFATSTATLAASLVAIALTAAPASAAAPAIAATWSQDVINTEATLKAEADPEGKATTYHFDYGTSVAYGSETPELAVGSDSSVHKVSRSLDGLQPGTTYHYRVVATNVDGVTPGPDRTFRTYEPFAPETNCANQILRVGASANLPDCRAYEMVSPVDKNGADIISQVSSLGINTASDQAARDGNKMTFSAATAFGDSPSSLYTNQYMATRGAGGWSTHAITPHHEYNRGFGIDLGIVPGRYSAFTEDLTKGFLSDDAKPPLTPEALTDPNNNAYLRNTVTETYETLTSQSFAGTAGNGGMGLMGYSEDGSHTLFAETAALTPDAKLGSTSQLYVYHEGDVELVSVLPNGEPAGNSSAGAAAVFYSNEPGETEHAISADGSRIFWTTDFFFGDSRGKIYARIDNETTVPVSESVTPENTATYWNASVDGSTVIFSVESNLYKFDVDTETPTLVAGKVKPASGVLGVSDDASRIYFLSEEALDAGATAGKPNLYRDDEGTKTFIATLDGVDGAGDGTGGTYSVANSTAVRQDFSQVTPDGRYLVFQSRASLTGYDNTSANTGIPAIEVYIYDADAQELDCVSCNPSGGRPQTKTLGQPFVLSDQASFAGAAGGDKLQAAAWLPTRRRATYTPRMVADDGSRIFFNSHDALVPRDVNGAQDVYEWVKQGVGGCGEADGCVYLISTGANPKDSTFIDASEGGDEVFFRTSANIDPDDPGLIDIYVARVDGGFPRPVPPPPCVGDACQSVPAAPNDPTPASASFNGAGDPTAKKPRRTCRVRGRQAKQGGTAKHKKAKKRCKRNNRRAGR